MRADDPVTTSVDESLGRSWDMYLGSIVCQIVDLSHTRQFSQRTPFPELVEFGSAGFGSDMYPNNLWYINPESIEFVPRQDW